MPAWVHELFPFLWLFYTSFRSFSFLLSFIFLSKHFISMQSEFFASKQNIRVLRIHEIFSVFFLALSFLLRVFLLWYFIQVFFSSILFRSFLFCLCFISQFNSFKIYHKYVYTIWFYSFFASTQNICVCLGSWNVFSLLLDYFI